MASVPALWLAAQSSTTGVDTFDEAVNVYSRNMELPVNIPMQGFSLDSDGNIWYTLVSHGNKEEIHVSKAMPNPNREMASATTDKMKLTYFGHGTNTAVEEVGNDRYVWAGCYGSCNAKGEYWTEKLVGRVKYVKDATVPTDKCDEYYYIGDYTDMHPSIDAENDLLTINYSDRVNGSFRCFVVYKLSEAKKAPLRDVTITCTDGFRTGNAKSTNPVSVTVKARDLTTLKPIARPKFLKTGYGKKGDTYYAWQGFDVKGDRLYYADGQSNIGRNGRSWEYGTSRAYITVFDLEGNVVEPRTEVAIIGDREGLSKAGLSDYWNMESEGLKVKGDSLYLGFGA
ncbi:MAG: hypothetical protein K2M76_01930, partial [Muribaculaceae bacterium]|nr:hypothetical protein [Muribaculaceae bacterium]